ncbi:glycosyltransferase family 4 protein [Pseudanabaena yagii]|uniref:Glycosyltransferase family 4 protein n=1 Tax=Pseudanabaena yagii GIHE-NHR1 TaxID=2722753 RepID=A0ABX1LWI0_9CYAN|nr:glycosyltransferase family 4 protein [Pseudanabaena yagii]NMF60548.1 glycosyltransferase family 4 protein [Pseudanabaena yagii GIHE-NHR1]
MQNVDSFRIAWLLPVAWFYWQPVLSEFTSLFPETTVFTGLFPGFARNLEGTFKIEIVGKFQVIEITKNNSNYGNNFTNLSLKIVNHLIKLKPKVIFSSSFGIWTIIALLLKPFLWWRVIIAYEGSSPGVDYRNSPIRLFVRRLMVWMADAYISNSQTGGNYLIEILNANKDKVFVQPYEIPDERTLPSYVEGFELDISSDQRPVFIFVGQVVPRKGLPLLLQAFAVLQERGYNHYTLLVVGDGEQREELEAFCKEHNLSDRVQWTGRVAYDLIGSYFRNADIFVFPTLEDTWGVVTLEAMLLGKPILCSQGAGTSELIIDGENGYVFTPDDHNKLADLIQNFLDHPELIASMGDRSRQIMAQYNPVAAAQCLANVTNLVMRK